jgi:hypothetical protein
MVGLPGGRCWLSRIKCTHGGGGVCPDAMGKGVVASAQTYRRPLKHMRTLLRAERRVRGLVNDHLAQVGAGHLRPGGCKVGGGGPCKAAEQLVGGELCVAA